MKARYDSHEPSATLRAENEESKTMALSTMTTQSTRTADRSATADESWTRPWLRAEGVGIFAAGLAGFLFLGLPWWAFALLLIVPDVSMVGYLRGPRVGAVLYNLVHDLATGVAVAGVGLAIGSVPLAAAGAILVAHSGMDRIAGYGLKYPDAFRHTHLGWIGRDR
jgi:hypothetical protein